MSTKEQRAKRNAYMKEFRKRPEPKLKHAERVRKWQTNNPEKVKLYKDKWSTKNPNYSHLWYLKHVDEVKTRTRKRYRDNRVECLERSKKYAEAHPEAHLRACKRNLQKNTIAFNMKTQEYLYAINSWSKTIKKLDNNMCKICDSVIGLNAHHIIPKCHNIDLSLDLDNGITLCHKCHMSVHHI